MSKPPTLIEVTERGLLTKSGEGIHTFSNGTEWDLWAGHNCFDCRWWDEDQAGKDCAFEGAAMLDMVSPELARFFGWTEKPQYPGCFRAPEQCPHFRHREERDDGDRPPRPTFTDPLQLVLLADPTEDAAVITNALTHETPASVAS